VAGMTTEFIRDFIKDGGIVILAHPKPNCSITEIEMQELLQNKYPEVLAEIKLIIDEHITKNGAKLIDDEIEPDELMAEIKTDIIPKIPGILFKSECDLSIVPDGDVLYTKSTREALTKIIYAITAKMIFSFIEQKLDIIEDVLTNCHNE
jgi:hypothetical protein